MRNIYLILFAAFILCSSCVNHIYLSRHAERLDNSSNSPLSEEGSQRANTLKDTLLNKSIDLIYATPYLRTQQTAQPTADAFGKELTIYGTDSTFQFVQAIKKLNGKNLLIVGHSNTVPEMVNLFTSEQVEIGHDDYDNLYRIRVKKGIGGKKYSLQKLKYGE